MSTQHRISQFWLSGGHITDPDADLPQTVLYVYAVEYADAGPVVHRFRDRADRAAWLAQDERRHMVKSGSWLVRLAKQADVWPDEGEEA